MNTQSSSTANQPDRASGAAPIWVTVIEARRISGLGVTKIYEMLKSGELRTTTVGRRRLIAYSSLVDLGMNAPA